MSHLVRHTCRRARAAWQQQQRQQSTNITASTQAPASSLLMTDSLLRNNDWTTTSTSSLLTSKLPASNGDLIHLEFAAKLQLTTSHPETSMISSTPPSTLSHVLLPHDGLSLRDNLESPSLTFAPASIGRVIGDFPSITPPVPSYRKIEIREPTKNVSIIISDGLGKDKAVVGDQPTATQEIIGDKMENVVKKEAIRILQIRRTKMNRHKLRKWRRKFRHLIKKRIEEKEKQEQKEMDDAVAAIHGDAEAFNPVDKVRSHIAMAKEMGYKVAYYENLAVTKWLKEKEAEDAANSTRFVDKNTERYRKYPPWEYEKF